MDDKELEKLQNSLNALDNLNSSESSEKIEEVKENSLEELLMSIEENKETVEQVKFEDFEDIEDIENADISDEQLLAILERTLAEELQSIEEAGMEQFEIPDIELSPEKIFEEEVIKLEPTRQIIDTEKKVASGVPSEEAILETASSPILENVAVSITEEVPKENPKKETEKQIKKEAKKEEPKKEEAKKEEDLESILAQTLEESQKEAPGDKEALDKVERSLLASIVQNSAQNSEQTKAEAENLKKSKIPKKIRGSKSKKPKKPKKGTGFFVLATATMATAAAASFFLASHFMPDPVEPLFVDAIPISSPYIITSNSGNFIFVREMREVGNINFNLERIVIDSMHTTFVFSEEINWDNFSVSLTDNLGRNYYVHHSFFANSSPNMLIFESLRSDVAGTILTITEIQTGEEATFPLEFVGDIVMSQASHMYLNSTKNVAGTYFSITGGYFTPIRSVVYYTVRGSYIPNIRSLFLTHGATNLPVINHESFDLGHLRLGRVEFNALNNLSGIAQVRFPEAVIYQPTHTFLDVSGLLANNTENQIYVETENGTLALLRMARLNTGFIMVTHAFDTNGNRVGSSPNASLVLTTPAGEVVLEPTIHSGPQGSDVVFNMPDGGSLPAGISQINLRLYGIYFETEAVNVDIDLDNLLPTVHISDSIVITQAVNHLTSMGYHSATVIAYERVGLNFYGIFSARFHDIVTIYSIRGQNTQGDIWQFTGNYEEIWIR